MNTNTNTTHHGGLDGALAGVVLSHEGAHGHTGRDAVLGGIAGHEAEKHHERSNLNADGTPKVPIGDKISGSVEKMVGKVTIDPVKVAEGEAKKPGLGQI